jgi:hypothetical protein
LGIKEERRIIQELEYYKREAEKKQIGIDRGENFFNIQYTPFNH